MTPAEYAEIAAAEICERLAGALGDINDACADECPLTPRQKTLVGTAIIRECCGLNVDLARMFESAAVLESWTRHAPAPIGDEIEAFRDDLDRWGFPQ